MTRFFSLAYPYDTIFPARRLSGLGYCQGAAIAIRISGSAREQGKEV
jgi:hypothetical protein